MSNRAENEIQAVNKCLETLRDQLYKTANSRNWSFVRLSTECGISRREMAYILNMEKKQIGLTTLAKISDALGIPLIALIDPDVSKQMEMIENAKILSKELFDHAQKMRACL